MTKEKKWMIKTIEVGQKHNYYKMKETNTQ